MRTPKSYLRKITPTPILSLVWRYDFIKSTKSFSERPIRSVFKLGRWMLYIWTNRKDIVFDTPDGTHFLSMVQNLSSFFVYFADYRDPSIQAFLVKYLHADSVFVDAGANIGTYTMRAAQRVGKEGKVIAIEAHPLIYGYLLKNIELNDCKGVTPVNVALGDTNGTIEMSFNSLNAGETHVAISGEQKVNVPLRTLDDVLSEVGVQKVDYLKIDVEGFEYALLKGAESTIIQSPNIVIQTELDSTHSQRYGHPIADVINLLFGLGLTPHTVDIHGDTTVVLKSDIKIPSDVLWWREK